MFVAWDLGPVGSSCSHNNERGTPEQYLNPIGLIEKALPVLYVATLSTDEVFQNNVIR